MQSLGMPELWITGNVKKKINVSGKIAKNVVYFFQIRLSVNSHILFIHNKRFNILYVDILGWMDDCLGIRHAVDL